MTDTVLQSFCERCGKRYTFTEQEHKPEGGLSVLGRLVKRGPDAAPGGPTVSTALPSSDRFDGTFHFCLECRQYTCGNCWNAAAGYCVGCRPPGQVAEPAAIGRTAPPLGKGAPSPAPPSKPMTPPPPSGSPIARDSATAAPSTPDSGPKGSPAASPWSSGDSVASAILGASIGSDPTGRSPSGEKDPGKNLPWGAAENKADTVLDEWGRPVKRSAPVDRDAAADDRRTASAEPELDPWRGVVFSADEAGTVEHDEQRGGARPTRPAPSTAAAKPTASEWPASDQPSPTPERATDALAWPESDTRRRPSTQSTQGGPTPDTAWPDETRGTAKPSGAKRGAVTDDRRAQASEPVERPTDVERQAGTAASAGAILGAGPSNEPDTRSPETPIEAIAEPPAAEAVDVSLRFVEPSEVEVVAPEAEPVEAAAAEADSVAAADASEVPVATEAAHAEAGPPPGTTRTDAPADAAESQEAEADVKADTVGNADAEVPDADAQVAVADADVAVVEVAADDTDAVSRATDADEAPSAAPEATLQPDALSFAPAAQDTAGADTEPDRAESAISVDAEEPVTGSDPPPAAAVAPIPEPTPKTDAPMPEATPDVPTHEAPPATPGARPTPPLVPLPTPSAPQPWGSEVASGPFSQPYATAAPLAVPPPPSPGLPQPPAAPPPQGGPPPSMGQAPMPSQAPRPAGPAMPQPGLVPPPPMAASMTAPLPTRGDRAATRACANCALPLSAKARFCRRCGAPQA